MNEIVTEEDAIKAVKKKTQSIITNVLDFNFIDIITRYVKNGGYVFGKSLEENVTTFLQVVALQKALGKI